MGEKKVFRHVVQHPLQGYTFESRSSRSNDFLLEQHQVLRTRTNVIWIFFFIDCSLENQGLLYLALNYGIKIKCSLEYLEMEFFISNLFYHLWEGLVTEQIGTCRPDSNKLSHILAIIADLVKTWHRVHFWQYCVMCLHFRHLIFIDLLKIDVNWNFYSLFNFWLCNS